MKFLLALALVVGVAYAGNLPAARVGGGLPAADNEFTFQVSIRVGGFHICSGVIANLLSIPENTKNQWIITSASCVAGQSDKLLQVYYGSHNRKIGGKVVGVAQVILHKEFDRINIRNDVALIKTAAPITAGLGVNIATANDIIVLSESTEIQFAGWGVTGITSGELTPTLMKVVSNIVRLRDCAANYTSLIPIDTTEELPTKFCVGDKDHGVKAACAGDAGGPAFMDHDILGERVFGIASFSADCGTKVEHPSVFTFLGAFRKWIDDNIAANSE